MLSETTEAKKINKKKGQTLFCSNPKPGQPTQIQPNRIYSRVPLRMVICGRPIGSDTGAPLIDSPTTTQPVEDVQEEETLTPCCCREDLTSLQLLVLFVSNWRMVGLPVVVELLESRLLINQLVQSH